MCVGCGDVHEVPERCQRRTCGECAGIRYSRLRRRYDHLNEMVDDGKLVTLTLRRVPGRSLQEQLERLRTAYSRLRRRAIWAGVTGSMYAIEAKPPTPTRGGWNVHLHAVVDGPWLPKGQLSDAWRDLTGDSYIVDVQQLRHPDAGVSYILGYTASERKVKATWDGVLERYRHEYEDATAGRRMVQTTGLLHGLGPVATGTWRCAKCGGANRLVMEMDLPREAWPYRSKPPPLGLTM